jgi:hypothetical protein
MGDSLLGDAREEFRQHGLFQPGGCLAQRRRELLLPAPRADFPPEGTVGRRWG